MCRSNFLRWPLCLASSTQVDVSHLTLYTVKHHLDVAPCLSLPPFCSDVFAVCPAFWPDPGGVIRCGMMDCKLQVFSFHHVCIGTGQFVQFNLNACTSRSSKCFSTAEVCIGLALDQRHFLKATRLPRTVHASEKCFKSALNNQKCLDMLSLSLSITIYHSISLVVLQLLQIHVRTFWRPWHS